LGVFNPVKLIPGKGVEWGLEFAMVATFIGIYQRPYLKAQTLFWFFGMLSAGVASVLFIWLAQIHLGAACVRR